MTTNNKISKESSLRKSRKTHEELKNFTKAYTRRQQKRTPYGFNVV